VVGDELLAPEVHAALAAQFDYVRMRRQTLPFKFACPSGVLCAAESNWGATEVGAPWADAATE
jgi:gamma-glutamyltranspeptidase/glutathione hydrolase